ncbi:hypothetical protein [Desulforhopalus sp. 52FAK]
MECDKIDHFRRSYFSRRAFGGRVLAEFCLGTKSFWWVGTEVSYLCVRWRCAPRNFEKDTIEKFIDGMHFLPVSKGTLFNRNLKATNSIGARMFYSQSGMFVRQIVKNKPLLFKKFIVDLQTGKDFKECFIEVFHSDVDVVLNNYIENIRKKHSQSLDADSGNSSVAG